LACTLSLTHSTRHSLTRSLRSPYLHVDSLAHFARSHARLTRILTPLLTHQLSFANCFHLTISVARKGNQFESHRCALYAIKLIVGENVDLKDAQELRKPSKKIVDLANMVIADSYVAPPCSTMSHYVPLCSILIRFVLLVLKSCAQPAVICKQRCDCKH